MQFVPSGQGLKEISAINGGVGGISIISCICLPEMENYCVQIGIAQPLIRSVSGRRERAESAQRNRYGAAAKSQSAALEKDIGHGTPKLERPSTAVRSLVASHPEEV